MAKIKINGDNSGYVEIAAPNAAHNNTLELGPGTKILTDKNTHTGNIGIGTDNPVERLHVSKNSATGPSIYITNDSTGHTSSDGLQLGFDGSNNVEFRNRENTQILLYTNNTEKVRIKSDGKVGIGTNNPNRLLQVDGASGGNGQVLISTDGAFSGTDTADLSFRVYANPSNGNAHNPQAQIQAVGTGSYDAALTFKTAVGGSDNNTPLERLRIKSNGKVGINTTDPSYMLEVHNPDPGNDSKQSIQKWINTNQNTLELNMYGGTIDQCQFATINAEQTLSFLTGLASGSVDSTETSLLLTQNRDGWFQGPDTSNYGGGIFIGAEASPYGNLCALRDNNKRPLIYMGGQYPEITLQHTVASNANHGGVIRFATYVQSTNTATGKQFSIGPNGSGTRFDIGYADAAQDANAHNGIANHNSGTTKIRVDATHDAVKIPGHVIQVGYARHDPNSDSYTTVGQDTKSRSAAYLDFTPKYANSQLLIITRMHTRLINANGCSYGIDVSGNSGSTWTALNGMSQRNAMDFFYKGDQVNHHYTGFCLTYISATNTNARRYSPWAQGWSGGTWEVSYGHGEHSVTVLEIAGTI